MMVQNLLDEITEINIPQLFDSNVDRKQRADLIKLARQKIKAIKRDSKQEQEVVKKKYDGRNRLEAKIEKLALEPYRIFDTHVSDLEIAISELDIANKNNNPLPACPEIGFVYIENIQGYDGVILDRQNALKYCSQEGKSVKAELEKIKKKKPSIFYLKGNSCLYFFLGALSLLLGFSFYVADIAGLVCGSLSVLGAIVIIGYGFIHSLRIQSKNLKQQQKELQDRFEYMKTLYQKAKLTK